MSKKMWKVVQVAVDKSSLGFPSSMSFGKSFFVCSSFWLYLVRCVRLRLLQNAICFCVVVFSLNETLCGVSIFVNLKIPVFLLACEPLFLFRLSEDAI